MSTGKKPIYPFSHQPLAFLAFLQWGGQGSSWRRHRKLSRSVQAGKKAALVARLTEGRKSAEKMFWKATSFKWSYETAHLRPARLAVLDEEAWEFSAINTSLDTCLHTSRKPHRCGMRIARDAQSNGIGIIKEEILRRVAPPGKGSSQISYFGTFWNKMIILLLSIYGCTWCSLESTGWQTMYIVWHGFRNSQFTLVWVNGPTHSGYCLE